LVFNGEVKMDRREFLKLAALTGVVGGNLAAVSSLLSGCGPNMKKIKERFIILGFDGVDPKLLEGWVKAGELPNFARFMSELTYCHLRTTNPPESPVAWSSFATGVNPGNHNIFDFLVRDTRTYMPDIAQVSRIDPEFLFGLIPIKMPRAKCNRGGVSFWKRVVDERVPVMVLQAPVTFPPEELPGGWMLSGLGVPDIRGTQGTYHYFASDVTEQELLDTEMGGKVIRLELVNGKVETEIHGPWDPLLKQYKREKIEEIAEASAKLDKAEDPDTIEKLNFKLEELQAEFDELNARPGIITTPLRFIVDKSKESITIELAGERDTIKVGEWSRWFEISFRVTPIVSVKGICHFYLKQVKPALQVYMGPIEFDPRDPVLPVSYPDDFSKKLYQAIGLYKTRGWAADTAALQDEKIDEKTLLEDILYVMGKRQEITYHALDNYPWNLFVSVFSATDRVQHLYFRLIDKEHPRYDPELAAKYGDAILKVYKEVDRIIGEVYTKHVAGRDDTAFIVLSDHGFHPFRKGVNLNTWLVKNGFMFLKGMDNPAYNLEDLFGQGGDFWPNVVWERTKAYALGLGQIYINLRGREGRGYVSPGDYENVQDAIVAGLRKLRDPETGERVVYDVYKKQDIFRGKYYDRAPDLQVGFNRGYRVSWQTCLGGIPKDVVEPNMRKWSGDHCSFDTHISDGIFFINKKISTDHPHITDIAPSVLRYFGIAVPPDIEGKSFI
jgi:predicted AlkP superfamily phosphohydrolase/phosphomutase